VIVHDVSDPYFSEITRGIQRVAEKAGRLVTICNSYRVPERESRYFRLLRAQQVEAVVLAGSGLEDPEHGRRMAAQISAFESSGGRVSLVGRHLASGDTVAPDNFGGARALGEALIGLGHREFGVIGGPARLTSVSDRLSGFRAALEEAGLALPAGRVVEGDFSRDGGARGVRDLLAKVPDLTAIFALNDQAAVGALSGLRAARISVPGEISVAGFDDIPVARDVTPELSTVRLPLTEMGARAMELALAPRGPRARVETFRAEVVLRASTAKPKGR
jgi:LacI family transcriptional regulator